MAVNTRWLLTELGELELRVTRTRTCSALERFQASTRLHDLVSHPARRGLGADPSLVPLERGADGVGPNEGVDCVPELAHCGKAGAFEGAAAARYSPASGRLLGRPGRDEADGQEAPKRDEQFARRGATVARRSRPLMLPRRSQHHWLGPLSG
jgi:hypothetical protein